MNFKKIVQVFHNTYFKCKWTFILHCCRLLFQKGSFKNCVGELAIWNCELNVNGEKIGRYMNFWMPLEWFNFQNFLCKWIFILHRGILLFRKDSSNFFLKDYLFEILIKNIVGKKW
jgi:hypothetical protein